MIDARQLPVIVLITAAPYSYQSLPAVRFRAALDGLESVECFAVPTGHGIDREQET